MHALEVELAKHQKSIPPDEDLTFGRYFTDHILSAEWTATDGWHKASLAPYHSLVLDPAAAILHYSFQAFEGMKAYKDKNGGVRLFRPDKNIARLNQSAAALMLPQVAPERMIELIKTFARVEERWIST
jgi:branched-chain amino acid aminotransferase